MEKHINLIRKIAWSFHHSTGINWDDLYSEACLAYYLAVDTFDKDYEHKESSWIAKRVQFRLTNFCKSELRQKNLRDISHWAGAVDYMPEYEVLEDTFQNLSDDVISIIKMVHRKPWHYTSRTGPGSKKAIGRIRRDLDKKLKWDSQRINAGMKKLRLELLTEQVTV